MEENTEHDEDFSDQENSSEFSDDIENNCFEADFVSEEIDLISEFDISYTIRAIREIVKLFKSSPTRNEILQKHVRLQEKKELQVLLDCKTRWNSLVTMVERFVRLKEPIKKTLLDLNMSEKLNEHCEKNAECLLKVLMPVLKSTEALSRSDANLLTAEGILKFLFDELGSHNSELSDRMVFHLKSEISKRRNNKIISLMKIFRDPNVLTLRCDDSFFKLESRKEILMTAQNLMLRLFKVSNALDTADEISDENMNLDWTLDEKLNRSIEKSTYSPNINNQNDGKTLKSEFDIYLRTGSLGPNLSKLKNALFTIRPTTTQNERNFSVSGNFVSKKRTRLSDQTVNDLCFLKFYFTKIRNQK